MNEYRWKLFKRLLRASNWHGWSAQKFTVIKDKWRCVLDKRGVPR